MIKVGESLPDVQFRQMTFEREVRFTEHLRAAHEAGFQPTAFFCAHDGLAVTVISELLRLGYRIPEDATVIGFGDFSAATQISPQLTTVKVQGQQIGAGCVRILDDRINERVPRDVPVLGTVAGSELAGRPLIVLSRRKSSSARNLPSRNSVSTAWVGSSLRTILVPL